MVKRFVAKGLSFFLIAAVAFAQSGGTITGTVADPATTT
jgi:hypothetical protein